MFAFTLPDQSDAMLEYFCDLECRIFDGLGIAYRVVDTATGDLGGPAYRKYDLEAWMPGRGDGGPRAHAPAPEVHAARADDHRRHGRRPRPENRR